MKDQLLEIVQHTHGLGIIDLVKVVGTATGTTVSGIAGDRSVIVEAEFNAPVAEFVGTFGMPNLSKLNTILNISEYREDAKLGLSTQKDSDGKDVPDGIKFENKAGDFKNDYRFMATNVINDKLKTVKFKGVKWGVEVEPSVLSVQRLKMQHQAHNEEVCFVAKTDDKGNLKFHFGDHSSHAGDFVFATNVTGSVSKAWSWPINAVFSILNLTGDKVLRFSDEGAAQITVDSGMAKWTYTIPAQTK